MTHGSTAIDLDLRMGELTDYVPDAAPVEAPSDPWLQRRTHAFGASDVPALLVGLGRYFGDVPAYVKRNARKTNRTMGAPRIVAEKAGLVAPLAVGSAAGAGASRERELCAEWRARLDRGVYDCDAEPLVVPESVRHADVGMRCATPWVDRHCHRLAATLDGWADDILGGELVVELKCTARDRAALPWHWWIQVQAQLAVTSAAWGLVVCGVMWAATWTGADGPIRVWEVQRDERVIAEIREACVDGWAMVEERRRR